MKWAAWRPTLGTDALLALACAGFVGLYNGPFWRAFVEGRELLRDGLGAVVASAVLIAALHFVFIAPLANRWTVKPLLSVLIVVAAVAGFYMQRYGVYLDASMLRNVLRTDV
ncbi:MAG: DUF1705 domain-containing protein, partial [Burkholderiales bacterium]|nr:DUF1705 domain-containing protein [Burkholderiales bacterium]